jgi:ubiquinone/menaquinone biosynthesis C-methylase UbiE
MRTLSQERWLRFFNRIVYNRMAPAYDALDWLTLGVWWRLVRRALDHVPTRGRVLEVGFGPGKLQLELARRVDEAHGVDLAWGMCRLTQQRLRRANSTSYLTCGSVFALPYRSESFETTVSTFAFSGFEHGEQALAEMVRVTADDGCVVLVDIGLPSDGNRLGTFLARLWEKMGDFLYDLPAMMRGAGLKVVLCQEFGPGKHIRAVVGMRDGVLRRNDG